MKVCVILVFRLSSKWILQYSWLLRSVREFETDVSELSLDTSFKDQAVQEEALHLKTEPIRSPETSAPNHCTPRN